MAVVVVARDMCAFWRTMLRIWALVVCSASSTTNWKWFKIEENTNETHGHTFWSACFSFFLNIRQFAAPNKTYIEQPSNIFRTGYTIWDSIQTHRPRRKYSTIRLYVFLVQAKNEMSRGLLPVHAHCTLISALLWPHTHIIQLLYDFRGMNVQTIYVYSAVSAWER